MTLLHWATISPFLFALLVPFLYKYARSIHTGWFVLILPFLLFVYFIQYIPVTMSHETVLKTIEWVPSLGINFTVYLDGLSLLFVLLITGIGSLVALYSIFYLSKKNGEAEQLLCLFTHVYGGDAWGRPFRQCYCALRVLGSDEYCLFAFD